MSASSNTSPLQGSNDDTRQTARQAAKPWPLKPCLAVADRLRTSARLSTLAVVLLIPSVVATVSYSDVIGGQITFATQEREGTVVLQDALTALADTVGGGTPDLQALRESARGHPDLALDKTVSALPDDVGATPAARAQVATTLAGLITTIGNNSNLILDPDLDSFYVMDVQIVQLPKALLAAAQAAAPTAAAGTNALVAEQAVHAGELSGAAGAIRSDVDTARTNTAMAGLATRLAALAPAADAIDALATSLTASLDRPGAVAPDRVAAAVKAAVPPAVRVLADLLTARAARLSGDRTIRLSVTICGLLIAIWFAAAVWWRTRHDVDLAVGGVTAIASGELEVKPLPAGRDELGDIGRALATARQRLVEQGVELRNAHAVREEQLHASFLHQRQAEIRLRDRAREMINESAGAIAGDLERVVAQVDEVRQATGTIDERVAETNVATNAVVERARQAERVVAALEASLRRVAGTAELIAGIAGQTRLLALNATIEADRAGEAGRGFTVVAHEVKDLAMTTAQSTEQITQTITSLEQDTADMASTIAAMVTGIGRIDTSTDVLRNVATDQRSIVGHLGDRVAETITRIQQMSELAEQLERRRSERITAGGSVSLRVAGRQPQPADLLDLSSGGLRCRVGGTIPLAEGDIVEVAVRLGEDGVDDEVVVHARVMHQESHEDGREVGLQFLATDPALVERIEQYVTGLLEGGQS